MPRSVSALCCAVLLTGLIVTAPGCESEPKSVDPVSVEEIRKDMTPELFSTGKSEGQAANHNARVIDNNTRGIWDDLSRLFFFDETSPLTPYPTP